LVFSELVNTISRVTFFTSLLPDEKLALSKRAKEQVYPKNEVIFRKGDPGLRLYIIKSGKVKIVLPSQDGKEAIIAILSNGDFFGELSLFDGKPRSASAITIDDTDLLTIHRDHFLQFIQEHPHVASDILAVVSSRLRQADNLVEDASFLDLPARLAKRLLDLADEHGVNVQDGVQITLKLTQQDIAGMVGATRESVNKQLKFCQDRGVLKMESQHLIILKPEELRKRIY
jgi:CRP/FNR family transcriptional regulator/CRP/FNR family cyclic AMP-dependent transcriptional regulator